MPPATIGRTRGCPDRKKPCEAAQIVNVEADIKIAVATAVFIIQKAVLLPALIRIPLNLSNHLPKANSVSNNTFPVFPVPAASEAKPPFKESQGKVSCRFVSNTCH